MSEKKYASINAFRFFLDNLKNTFASLAHKHTISDITDYTVDSELSSTSTNPVQNKVLDTEFEAISDAMGALEAAIDGKSDSTHAHDDRYYTEEEVDTLLSGKSNSDHNHDSVYETKTDAQTKLDTAKTYTDTKTADLASTTVVDNKITTHNTSTSAHNDIRALIDGLTTRLNTLADSDDTTLDQMSEVVAYIKSNKELIDAITTSKVNVSDIVDNLTTNISNKPLSASQGVVIKGLIDALQAVIDTKANASDLTSHVNNKSNPHGVTLSQLGITATAAELNKMDGVTATTAELNYVDGVTSNIQTQLNGKASSTHNHVATEITSGTLSSDRLPTIPIAKGGIPVATTSNNGQFLRVVSGTPTWTTVANAEGVSF